MQIAVSLNPVDASVRQLVDAARAAEAAGLDAVYTYDHISGSAFGGSTSTHVWTVLGAIAVSTERVRIGSLVANVTTRPAVDIALAAATLQDASAGRFVLGLGAGASGPTVYADEMRMFGLVAEPSPRRRARVTETIELLRALWRGDDRFDGAWASFAGVGGVAVPRPVCPVFVGSNGPLMTEVAAVHADGVNFHSWQDDLDGLVGLARTRVAARGHGSFTVSVEGLLSGELADPDGEARTHLVALGVDELILAWRAEMGTGVIDALS